MSPTDYEIAMERGDEVPIENIPNRRHRVPPWLICIDVETTGLRPDVHGLLSIGAYHPASRAQFYVECRPGKLSAVDPAAMRVNGQDIDEAVKRETSHTEAMALLLQWLERVVAQVNAGAGRFVLVGKNLGFDYEWLTSDYIVKVIQAERFRKLVMRRMIDVHAVALALAVARGLDVPAAKIEAVYEALGLPVEPRPHNAFRGAKYAWLALAKLGESLGIVDA